MAEVKRHFNVGDIVSAPRFTEPRRTSFVAVALVERVAVPIRGKERWWVKFPGGTILYREVRIDEQLQSKEPKE